MRVTLFLLLAACRCGPEVASTEATPVAQASEAGTLVELPEAAKPPIPDLNSLLRDQASVERNMIDLKSLGLGYLVDAGKAP
jgi:hypothetical protein